MLETIYLALVAAAPAITAVVGIVSTAVKMINNGKKEKKEILAAFDEVKAEVHDNKQYDELKAELALVHAENRAIRKQHAELLTELTRIQHKEEEV